ncbi:Gfo/Idh/MocA family protein [Vallitalea maricola]|uniref:Uncharacterized protein n=1 Tax=Vallitalea maricola TaxID=3074433 RepID=A0ACB5UH78_9FIRM|nr:hypothetical protein AN2V17_11700 [Vallitalea sp. AN17-2]
MKVAIIGCGGMGTMHIRSLKILSEKYNIEVVALADCRSEFLEKATATWPKAKKYNLGMDLINDGMELDFIDICLPSYLHTEHAIKAMERGYNIFVEKPVCLTKEEGVKLIETQKKTNVKAMVGHVVRFFEEYQFLKKIYEEKTYGKLKSLIMHRIGGKPTWGFENWFINEEKSGSVVLDLHIHDLDFIRYMLGEPKEFRVNTTSYTDGMINQIISTYKFDETFAVVEGTWDETPCVNFEAYYRASFEDATVIYHSNLEPKVQIFKKNDTVQVYEYKDSVKEINTTNVINISEIAPYKRELEYFINCILLDKEVEIANIEDSVKTVNLAINEKEKRY